MDLRLLLLLVVLCGCHRVLPLHRAADLGVPPDVGPDLVPPLSDGPPPGWHCSWRFQRSLVYQGVPGETLPDFPALLVLSSQDIDYLETQPGGADIRFMDDAGNLLAHEVETWNDGGPSYVWVKIPWVDESGGEILMVYGNKSPKPPRSPTETWDAYFRGVWHLAESVDGPGATRDSTFFGNHGTAKAGSAPPALGVGGMVGLGMGLKEGSHILVGKSPTLALTREGTLEAWIKLDTISQYSPIMGKTLHGNCSLNQLSYALASPKGTDELGITICNNAPRVAYTSRTEWTSWYYVVGRWDKSALTMFVDGSRNGSSTPNVPSLEAVNDASHVFRIGYAFGGDAQSRTTDPTKSMDGTIDEVRVSAVARSDGWIKAQFRAMTGQFFTVGGAVAVSCP